MTVIVSIAKGYYRGEPVSGKFTLIKPYTDGARGGYITIKNPTPKHGHPPVQRITIEKDDFKLLDDAGEELAPHMTIDISDSHTHKTSSGAGVGLSVSTNYEQAFLESETDAEAIERISDTFSMLEKMADGCARNSIRGLVVSGPPGIGKSFGVEKQLNYANLCNTVKGVEPNFEILSGGISAIGMYQKLYYNRTKDRTLILDDADSAFDDKETLSLLKAALNSGSRRRICWNKESRVLNVEDIPEQFDFEGSIIVITNIDFERTVERGSDIGKHLAAILSRCHYLDLDMGSLRDRLLVIKLRIQEGMLKNYNLSAEEEEDIMKFIINNAEYLREVSLRMAIKIADIVAMDNQHWYEMAEATTLIRDSRFKRLYNKKKEAEAKGLVLIGE